MEAFDIGAHVTIELDEGLPDARRIAGYIHGVTEEGLILKVTHKDIPFVAKVADGVRDATRDYYSDASSVSLKLELLRRGEFAAALSSKAVMVELLTDMTIDSAVEVAEARQAFTLYEYTMPVLTYVGLHKIGLMEATTDVADEVDVVKSVGGLDAEIPKLLDGQIPPRDDERVMDDERDEGKPV